MRIPLHPSTRRSCSSPRHFPAHAQRPSTCTSWTPSTRSTEQISGTSKTTHSSQTQRKPPQRPHGEGTGTKSTQGHAKKRKETHCWTPTTRSPRSKTSCAKHTQPSSASLSHGLAPAAAAMLGPRRRPRRPRRSHLPLQRTQMQQHGSPPSRRHPTPSRATRNSTPPPPNN